MKAIVTGGTGFVGSAVVRVLLQAGHTVRVLHRTTSRLTALEGLEYESAIGDVTDLDLMRQAFAGCDWVFHVAAVADYWRADKDWMFEVNVEGTRRVLQAADEAGVQRVIFTSSAAAIGLPKDADHPSDENAPFNLPPEQFPYGYSKVLAEDVVQEAVERGQDVVTVNPVVIIGPGDLNMISGTFITQVAQWQWLTPLSSGGIAVTDVRDVAASHLAAAEHGISGERYILQTENISNRDWFQMIAEVIGVGKPFFSTPDWMLPGVAWVVDRLRGLGIDTPLDANQVRLGGRFVYFDGSKAHEHLHQPKISMRQSIADTHEWYQEKGMLPENMMTALLAVVGSQGRR